MTVDQGAVHTFMAPTEGTVKLSGSGAVKSGGLPKRINTMPKPSDLLQGTLDLLILKTIARKPLHGWGIAKRIQALSGDALSVGQGSLYPALHRLENQGWDPPPARRPPPQPNRLRKNFWADYSDNQRGGYFFAAWLECRRGTPT